MSADPSFYAVDSSTPAGCPNLIQLAADPVFSFNLDFITVVAMKKAEVHEVSSGISMLQRILVRFR